MMEVKLIEEDGKQYLYLPDKFKCKTKDVLFYRFDGLTYICPDTEYWRKYIESMDTIWEDIEKAKQKNKY